jgi:hypothetical protein
MFEWAQQPQFPPKRPERSGFLAISIFCITFTIGVVAPGHTFINSKPSESKSAGASDRPLASGKGLADQKMAGDYHRARAEARSNVDVTLILK